MILNIYKEKGWTSFDVVAKVRGMLGRKRKVGHAGTLDPLAEKGFCLILFFTWDGGEKKGGWGGDFF